MRLPLGAVVGKERPQFWEQTQDAFELAAKADYRERSCLLPKEAHDLVLPVDVLGREVGDICLGAAQVSTTFVVIAPLKVELASDDGLLFRQSDGAFLLKVDLRPSFLGENRPGQPTQV
jgi:hypothetical protein